MDEVTYVEGFHYKNEVSKMTYNELGKTGLRVSRLSLGGGPLGGMYESLGESEAVSVVHEALKHGMNYIDTSPWYGQGRSETFIGKALKSIPRQAYYIGTKIGRYELDVERMFDFSAARVKKSVDESLQLLGLDYVDIIQIHDLEFVEDMDQIINETLPAVQKIVEEGKARFLGITGYPLSVLKEVVGRSQSVRIDTILTYSRYTLIDQDLKGYLPFLKEREIGVINAGLVGLGLLTPEGGQDWHPATGEIRDASDRAREHCKEHNIDIAALAIKYSLMIDDVATHLVGAGTLAVMKKNLKTATTPPTEHELRQIEDIRKRFFSSLVCTNWETNDELMNQLTQIRKGNKK